MKKINTVKQAKIGKVDPGLWIRKSFRLNKSTVICLPIEPEIFYLVKRQGDGSILRPVKKVEVK